MAIWSGSINSSTVLSDAYTPAIAEIEVALDAVNSTDIKTYANDIALMGFMIKEKEGTEGTFDIAKEFNGLFQDDSEHLDPEESETTYAKWYFTRKAYSMKTGSFDKKTFKNAIENKIDIEKLVADQTVEILGKYRNVYLPCIIFDTILTVPQAGGGFYELNHYGFVRNTEIKPSKVINYDPTATAGDKGSAIRNNFRAIASNTGLSSEDIKWFKSYMGEIEGIDEENLLVLGNSDAISEFEDLYPPTSRVLEDITVNGMPTGIQKYSIYGITPIVTKSLPPKMLLFINPDSKAFITKLISPEAMFRGVAIETMSDEDNIISNVKSLQGSKVLIQEEGLTTFYC